MAPWKPKEADVGKKTPAPTPQPVPSPATIDEARAQGLAIQGQMISAPLTAKSGDIQLPPGSFVVTVVKGFWQSPTIVAIRNAVFAAVGLALLGVAGQVMAANGDLSQINWQNTQKIAIGTICFALASAYAAWWKKRDNDPTQ
jgi:hypothetical protein